MSSFTTLDRDWFSCSQLVKGTSFRIRLAGIAWVRFLVSSTCILFSSPMSAELGPSTLGLCCAMLGFPDIESVVVAFCFGEVSRPGGWLV